MTFRRRFALRLLLAALVLVLVWPWFAEGYRLVLQSLGNALRETGGAQPMQALYVHYTYALVPGLALVLAQPSRPLLLQPIVVAGMVLGFLLLDALLFAFAIDLWTGRPPESGGVAGRLVISVIHTVRVGLPAAVGVAYLLRRE